MNERLKKGLNTSGDWVSNFLLIGLAVLVLAWFASPARAAACESMDTVLHKFEVAKAASPTMDMPVMLDAKELAALKGHAVALGVSGAASATRGFKLFPSSVPGATAYGLEVGGCVLPPIYSSPEAPSRAPGKKLDSTEVHA